MRSYLWLLFTNNVRQQAGGHPIEIEVDQRSSLIIQLIICAPNRVAVISAKNHKRQRLKCQSVTAKREKSQTPKVLNEPNLA